MLFVFRSNTAIVNVIGTLINEIKSFELLNFCLFLWTKHFCGRNEDMSSFFFLILDESSWLIRICRIKKGVTISNYVLTIIYLDLIRFLFHFINKIQNQSLQIKCLKKVIFAQFVCTLDCHEWMMLCTTLPWKYRVGSKYKLFNPT